MNEKVMVGNVEIIALLDMVPPPRSPFDFFPDAPPNGWKIYEKDSVLDDGMIQLYYGCFLVRSSGKNVLVDTGIGPGPHVSRGNKKGNLLGEKIESFKIYMEYVLEIICLEYLFVVNFSLYLLIGLFSNNHLLILEKRQFSFLGCG